MKRNALALCIASLVANAHAVDLSGTVTNKDGAPVVDATIQVVGSNSNTKTDENGRFSLRGLGDSPELHVLAPGYNHHTVVSPEQNQALDIVLSAALIEQVDVLGLPFHLSSLESAQPVSVLAADQLRNKHTSTLGETLKNEVGVHSSYFGPVASSPIIRGLDGPRVLITQNGLDASDASRIGPDHIVAVETSTAQQVEILRGPATLFYGSGAIGGVVNIVDNRVPRDNETDGEFFTAHNTVAEENEIAGSLTTGAGAFGVHLDGFWRDSEDYEIPGMAEAEHDEEEHEGEDEHEHEEESGILPNSASESSGFNIGASWIGDAAYAGLSYGRLDRDYGIPGHAHGEEEEDHDDDELDSDLDEHDHEEEEEVRGELEQDRWQFLSELNVSAGLLSKIDTKIAYTDYEHREIEEGEVGTVFANETTEFRLGLQHKPLAGWRGAASIEYKLSDFEAFGEEAFTPPSETETIALALLEEKHSGAFLWQLGARVEQVDIEAMPVEEDHEEEEDEEHEELELTDSDFTPFSLSAGMVWDFQPGYNMGVSLTHAQRAPSAAELYSFGPHIGTSTFEIGALYELHEEEPGEYHVEFAGEADEEVSNNIDISLRKFEGEFGFLLSAFYNQISDFYYQRNTGLSSEDIEHEHEEEEEGEDEHGHGHAEDLPVFIFEQADATLYGYEAQFIWQAASPLKLTAWSDAVRGELDDGGNLPRIPPQRLGAIVDFEQGAWSASMDVTHNFEQDKLAENETPTDAYTIVNANVNYRLQFSDADLVLFLKGENLGDEEGRVHSSFIKDLAPLPGRGFKFGIRGEF